MRTESEHIMGNYLVTGVSSGLGLSLAKELIARQQVVYGISRTVNNLTELSECRDFYFFSFDLSKTEGIEDTLFPLFGEVKFDGFVHCAGIEETLPLSLYRPEKIENIFKINVFSAVELLRVLSKKKYSSENCSVILLSSVMGELGQPGKVGYCASKAAILGVVKSSALELAKKKIRVNAISPGVVDTPMTSKLFSSLDGESVEEIIKMHPLGIGKPSDVTSLVMFLLSEESRWLTGQNLTIDGGYSIQ